jgi:hypothetical protein
VRNLTEWELQALVADAQFADRALKGERNPLTPRIMRLLNEGQELRTQQAEREFHLSNEGVS